MELKFVYTNHQGDVRERRVIPIMLWYGTTEYYESQWLLTAFDLERHAFRDFAVRNIVNFL